MMRLMRKFQPIVNKAKPAADAALKDLQQTLF
jgi:hypothetical protein